MERGREREREGETERRRVRTLCIKPFVLLLFDVLTAQCCWIWLVWIVWQLVWTSKWQPGWKVRGTLRGRMVLPEVRYWELVESYGLQTLCECHERRCGCSAYIGTGENCCPAEDASWYGQRRASFGQQKSSGERTRKTPKETQWPEENGKAHRGQTKLDQQRIQTSRVRECKTGGGAREPQSAKGTLRVAFEEIKILREDSLREGDSVDKNRSHMVSPESTEEIRNVEQQELAFWRGPASKTLAGWTQDGSAEEIAGWMFEAQRLNREVEAKKRKFPRGDREGIQERCQNGRRLHGWCGWLSVVVRVQTLRLQAISEWKRPGDGKEFGSVECWDGTGVFESVELERGWTGLGGLFGHFPVADFDAHRLGRFVVARMSKKIGWSERWCSQIVHAVRTLGRTAMPRSHRKSEMERTIEDCRWCGKMDCGRAGWTDDFRFSPFATQRNEIGEFEAVLMDIQDFIEWEIGTAPDPGRRLKCELLWIDRLSSCGRVDPKTENADGQ